VKAIILAGLTACIDNVVGWPCFYSDLFWGPSLSSMANRLVSLEECGKRSRSAEPSATLKKQSGINGLLPSLAALGGPLHLFRLLLDLCSRFSNRVAVTFPQEKSLLDFPG